MSAEQYTYDVQPPSFDTSPSEHRRWSWQSLDSSYRTIYPAPDHRFSYIVRKLLDSETARRFTVGEAFLLPGREGRQGRGLYFTNLPYGVRLHEVPHVVAYASPDKSKFFIDYCHGFELISSHIAPWGKEIPCLLSMLEILASD